MQEVFSKIIEELEEKRRRYFLTIANTEDEKLDCAYEYVGDALDKAIEIVKQEEEKYNNGWIPCSEQLPKESDKYNDELYPMCLVTIESGETCLGVFRYDVNKWYTKMFCGENNYSTERNVIAWQPLPAPYKET